MANEPAATEPAKLPNRWPQRIVLVLLIAVVGPVGASILYTYAPTTHRFYPGCMFNFLTGMHCPGCGATRGLYSLLHGNLEQAFAYNALFVILTPFIAYCLFRIAFSIWTGRKAPGAIPERVSKMLLVLLLVFWVVRNIPTEPFNLLAPHPLAPSEPQEPPPPPTP